MHASDSPGNLTVWLTGSFWLGCAKIWKRKRECWEAMLTVCGYKSVSQLEDCEAHVDSAVQSIKKMKRDGENQPYLATPWTAQVSGDHVHARTHNYTPPRWPSGKAPAWRVEDPRFESRLGRDFWGVESYQWLKNWHSSGYPARCLAFSTGTGQPGVSILLLGEVKHLICNFYFSVAAHKLV